MGAGGGGGGGGGRGGGGGGPVLGNIVKLPQAAHHCWDLGAL